MIAGIAKGLSTPTARRGIVAAASSGLVVTMAATTAFAAPNEKTDAATQKVSGSRVSATVFARAAAPTVTVPTNVEWTVDDVVAGVSTNRSATTAVVQSNLSSRDNARQNPPANVEPMSAQGHTTQTLRVRTGPGTGNQAIGSVRGYQTFEITGKSNGWYRVSFNGSEGWLAGNYVRVGAAPAAPAPGVPSGATTATGNRIVQIARQFVGTPYVWGGRAPGGFDCSGFTYYVYKQLGIELPVGSEAQARVGRIIPASEAMPGDLIWVPGHVGIYTGGWNHIAARNPGTPLYEGKIYMKNPRFIRLY